MFLGMFCSNLTGSKPNPTRNHTKSEPINSNYPNKSKYLRLERFRSDETRPEPEDPIYISDQILLTSIVYWHLKII